MHGVRCALRGQKDRRCAGCQVVDAAAAAWHFGHRAQRTIEAQLLLHNFCCKPAPLLFPSWQPAQVLYGRSGYLLGCLLLNKNLGAGSVPAPVMQAVVHAIIQSGAWRWQLVAGQSMSFKATAVQHWNLRHAAHPVQQAAHYSPCPHGICLKAALAAALAAAPWAHQLLTIMQAAAWRAGCASRPPSPPRCSACGRPARMALPTWELHTGSWVSHYLPSIHGLGVLVLPLCRAGRRAARGSGSPLYYFWHDKPYLGAAHGMIGEVRRGRWLDV